jgi:hypothetical protein
LSKDSSDRRRQHLPPDLNDRTIYGAVALTLAKPRLRGRMKFAVRAKRQHKTMNSQELGTEIGSHIYDHIPAWRSVLPPSTEEQYVTERKNHQKVMIEIWFSRRVAELDKVEGDIDTLSARIAEASHLDLCGE